MWKGARTLVTGGAGLIGSHLTDLLLARGAQVTVLDSLEPQTHPRGQPAWLAKDARFLEADVRSPEALREAVAGMEVVFHEAAFGGFTAQVSKYFDVNALGTARLYEALAEAGTCRRVVVASSQAIYGEGLHACPRHGEFHPAGYRRGEDLARGFFPVRCPQCDEPGEPRPTPERLQAHGSTAYALSKHFAERTSLALGQHYSIPTVALRYAVTYGPRQSVFNPYTGVVSIFSTRLLSGKPPVVYEDGEQTRDFIFVEDVARANLFVAEQAQTSGQVYNVGTGRAVSVLELVTALNALYGTSLAPEIRSYRPGDARHIVHDVEGLARLGFRAQVSLGDGLRRFASWIQDQGQVREYFEAAEQELRARGIVRDGQVFLS